jgi:alpha-L-rhamnosidase
MPKGIISFLIIVASLDCFSQSLSVINLSCENKKNSLGIESSSPSLSWQLNSNENSVMQTAYRILVSEDSTSLKKNIGTAWDSKKIISDQSIQVKYAGAKLLSAKTYFWKVIVWDNHNHASTWSRISRWQMGLLSKEDWKDAEWIAYEKIPDSLINILPVDGKKDTYLGKNILPLLRKSFSISKSIKKATLFICGLGHFELSINGKKIGDHFLDPGWTKYDKQALYVPFDVTNELKNGRNAIGVMLGNGFYYIPPVQGRYRKLKVSFGYPKMICRLAVEYSDGGHEDIISDSSWKTIAGPITFSSIYGGEDYDARLEQKDWDQSFFNDDGWKQVVIVDGPSMLNSQMVEPLKVMQVFKPQKITLVQNNSWVYDLGQNASGIPQIKVQGKKGDTIRIIPAELLKADGSANQKAIGGPYYLEYILKGSSIETWQPRFTYYGFRYLQINGAVPKGKSNSLNLPTLIDASGLHIRNAANKIGSFSCSNELFNRTYTLIDWAIKSNMVSLFTDCPHREKLGWLEEGHLMGSSVRYNYDVVNLFKKQIHDIKYSQAEDGLVPEIAPEYVKFEWGDGIFRDSPEWGSAAIIVPWYLYKWYGDKEILKESYDMMKRYAAYLQKKANGYILSQGLSDWYDLGPNPPGVSQLTPMGVTATAIYYYDLTILSKTASLLKKKEDEIGYEQLAFKVRQSFNDSFFHKDTKQYATGSQTANAMAIYMNLVEPEYKDAVIENIVNDVRKNGLTSGDIGYRYLLLVLTEAGKSDVVFEMNNRSDVPGYGYQLAKGATALTESWQALPTVSNNHFMLGHLMEWFYGGLCGIHQANDDVAFKNIEIRPQPVGDINFAMAEYHSPYGLIKSNWKKINGVLELNVTIPPNTTAEIYLPGNNRPSRIGSGSYHFTARLK